MQEEIFEGICDEIRGIDESADPIATTIQLRDFDHLLRETIQNKNDLRNLFTHFNKIALDESEFAVKLVYVITTRLLQNFKVDNLTIREVLLNILQFNFEASSKYKEEKIEKFYNSVTLLGECYNKVRLAGNTPIAILGKSLINILQAELDAVLKEKDAIVTEKLANLVLTQVVLNGTLAKAKHKDDLEQLMFSIRKCLIEISNLSSHTKSFLLMAIDLYYNNFLNLGGELESYYGKFLLDYDKPNDQTSKKLPALEKSLREKLQIKPAEVKFERPALAIDKKVEELVTQKDNLVPELINSQETVKPKSESPKKSSPGKNSKESHNTEDANKSEETSDGLKKSTDTSKNATAKQNCPKSPTIEKQQVKKNLLKSPQSSNKSSTNTSKNSKASSKPPEKPLRLSKEKEVPKSTDKNPVKSPKTPSNPVKSQQNEKSQKAPEKASSNLKKSQSKETSTKSEKSPVPKTEKSCNSEKQNGTESNETSETPQSNENQVINQIDFLDKNIKPNSVPETSDVTKDHPDHDSSNTVSKKSSEGSAPSSISNGNGADEDNILKQQNSCRELIGGFVAKEKFNGKVYFREENTENLTWENPNEDEMPETPPKLTPYSSSFLTFLSK